MFCVKCGAENPDTAQYCHSCGISTSAALDITPQYAGFWQRFAAVFIDGLILYLISIPVIILIAAIGASSPSRVGFIALLYPAFFAVSAVYFTVMESGEHGATFGKRLIGIKVMDSNGQRISAGRALGRWVSHSLSYLTLYIGFLIQPFTKHKQALHDMVSGTLVMNSREKTSTTAVVVVVGLFVTIAVIGILAAIAIPAYQDYVTKAKVMGGFSAAEEASRFVESYYLDKGTIPTTLDEAGYKPKAISHVSDLSLDQRTAEIIVSFNGLPTASSEAKHLLLTPHAAGKDLSWKCWSPDLEAKMLPRTCR